MASRKNSPANGAFFARDTSWHPPAYMPRYKSTVARSPKLALVSLSNSPGELTGPAFGHEILGDSDNDLVHNYARPGASAIGERIVVQGRVLDERGAGIDGVLLEFWQANAGGRYRHAKDGYLAPLDPNFGGCGRTITSDDGSYELLTVKPGPYPWPNGPNDWRPSHIHFSVFGRGFAQRLVTQMYFQGDPLIPLCPIVATIPSREAVDGLVAALDMSNTIPMDAICYKFDIVLRGRRSTMFENRLEGN